MEGFQTCGNGNTTVVKDGLENAKGTEIKGSGGLGGVRWEEVNKDIVDNMIFNICSRS